MFRWWHPGYWLRMIALVRHRERLALLLWPFLPARERHEDDAAPLQLLARIVRTIESGRGDFADDLPAQGLWREASADANIQHAATELRTLRLQLAGDSAAKAVHVERVGRQQLKPLRKRMHADKLDDSHEWLHGPLTLPLVSALFLFSGWMFNAIFFGHFGLPVGRYFALSDYLAASIDGLIQITLAMIFALLVHWLVRGRIRLQTLQNRLGGAWDNIGLSLLIILVTLQVMVTTQGIQSASGSEEQRLVYIFVLVLTVSVVLFPLLISFSQRPARDTLLLNFVVIYLVIIWYTAEMRYLNLDTQTRPSEIRLVTAPDVPLSWPIISGNSLYLFLLNEQNELVAVPVEQVLSVRYIRAEPDPVVTDPATPP
jgi:hypothetical protein